MITLDLRTPSLYFPYLREILDHLCVPYQTEIGADVSILLIDGSGPTPSDLAAQYRRLAEDGAWVVALGGVAGLPELFGAQAGRPIGEAWLEVSAPGHAFLADQDQPLHGFGVRPLTAAPEAGVLAALTDATGAGIGAGLTVRQVGRGRVIALAVDLPRTVLRIQQGWPVFQDGTPAADGSAPVNDGILKCDDGIALSYERDRSPAPEGAPFFARPIADQWRELLVRLLQWRHADAGQPLMHLWYWPEGVEAVSHISHDTDLCGEEPARTTIAELGRAGIPGTFCVIYPEKWPRQLYDDMRAAGHEVGFHYNAMREDDDYCHWGRSYIRHQVEAMAAEAGQDGFVTSKQHVFRWEGEVEVFRLLESAGLQIDGSKGGSKVGNYGFPFGSCHPWFPMEYGDYATNGPRMINVLEIGLLTMDMDYRSPLSTALSMMGSVKRYHGVAHYSPHPIWIHTKPEVARAIHVLVDRSRELGMPWWTSERINRWERARRKVTLKAVPGGVEISVPEAMPAELSDGAVAVYLPDGERRLTLDGVPVQGRRTVIHGTEGVLVPVTLTPGRRCTLRIE